MGNRIESGWLVGAKSSQRHSGVDKNIDYIRIYGNLYNLRILYFENTRKDSKFCFFWETFGGYWSMLNCKVSGETQGSVLEIESYSNYDKKKANYTGIVTREV